MTFGTHVPRANFDLIANKSGRFVAPEVQSENSTKADRAIYPG